MAGNSQRRGAMRKAGTKKGAVVGSGGQRSKGLEGKGPTPKAKDRTGHPAQRKANAAAARKDDQQKRAKRATNSAETVAGRNPVVECLRACMPATSLSVATGISELSVTG